VEIIVAYLPSRSGPLGTPYVQLATPGFWRGMLEDTAFLVSVVQNFITEFNALGVQPEINQDPNAWTLKETSVSRDTVNRDNILYTYDLVEGV